MLSPSAYTQLIQQQAELTEDDDPYDDLYETEDQIEEIEDELETV
jgi:hypothetical protein